MMKFSDFDHNLKVFERLLMDDMYLSTMYWEFQLQSSSAVFKSLSKGVPKSSFSEILTSFDVFDLRFDIF